jgi:hypothetical protein
MHWILRTNLSMHKKYGSIGFKDLASFNVAMIGKHGWKFETDGTSLATHLFKAHYFPNNDFLGSNIGHNPSYVWRSIFSTKMAVQHSIGSSATISIVYEPWIDDGTWLSGNSPGYPQLTHVKEYHLNDHSANVWKARLIYQLFDQHAAQLILKTYFHPLVTEDKFLWKAEKNGKYFLCSAYGVCVDSIVDNSHLCRPGRWDIIWKLKVPLKIKNLDFCVKSLSWSLLYKGVS